MDSFLNIYIPTLFSPENFFDSDLIPSRWLVERERDALFFSSFILKMYA